MTALLAHIQDHQNNACLLVGVIEALEFLNQCEDAPSNAVTTLLQISADLADGIFNGLDSVNLPRGGDA
ncbi:hypothetical protein [Pararhodobacter aggregans]